ncbi:transposase, partial [Streptococcus pseudopneumoniae]|uniref:transposase n=1 Tax=Streptococcus pseudopneumoniae TaxID=257758 RepID=UPI003D27C852
MTTPGIGPILGMTIMLETGDIKRFADVGDFASYCRCVGSNRLSNGKKRGRGIPRMGTSILGGLLWRQRTLRSGIVQEFSNIINGSRPRRKEWWLS